MPIVIADPPLIRRLARLIDMFGEILVIWTPLSLLLSLVQKAAGYNSIPILAFTHEWGGRFAWFIMLCLILFIARTDRAMLSPPSFRRTWWLVLSTLAAMLSVLLYALTPAWGWIPVGAISVGLTLVELASKPIGILVALYLMRTARVSGETTLVLRFRLLFWILIAESAMELCNSLAWRFWDMPGLLFEIHWWLNWALAFAYILLGLFAIRLARHLNTVAVREASRIREHP